MAHCHRRRRCGGLWTRVVVKQTGDSDVVWLIRCYKK